MTRGIRNNNPLNIRRSKTQWKGLKKHQDDPSFCQFENIIYGYRAAFRLMHTYYYKYNLHTLEQIIKRFAPPFENNTSAYMNYVGTEVKIPTTQELCAPDKNYQQWCTIIMSMSRLESLVPPSHMSYIIRAWRLAFPKENKSTQLSFTQ